MGHESEEGDWLVCSRTKAALTELDAVLWDAVSADDLQLRVMALHVIERGGKRLRPALLLLSASFGDFDLSALLCAAAALELTHVASLYHDDVMDRAPLRRRGVTTNARWGNAPAAFAGTYLFSRATDLWGSLGQLPNELASRALVDLCTGQLLEVENAYNLDLSEADHLSTLERKTATLFELPCRMGSLLSGALPSHSEALSTYGRKLGLAFQLVDDALDLTAGVEQIGKAVGNDLREGVYSLPVLRAVRSPDVGEELRSLLEQVQLGDDDLRSALRLVSESGTIDDVLSLAESYSVEAKEAVAPLPDGPAIRSLRRLAAFAVGRSF